MSSLTVAPFKFLHELHERIDARFRERVIDRRAHAADGTVPLEAVEARISRILRKPLLELLARQPERHVHARASVLLRVSAVEAGAIDLGVELLGLSHVLLLCGVEPA